MDQQRTVFAPQPGGAETSPSEEPPAEEVHPQGPAPDAAPEPGADYADHYADVPDFASPPPSSAVDVVYDQAPSSFAHEPPFRPRRNPARMWTALAVAFALLVAALIGAVSYWGVPDWVPSMTLGARPTFGAAQPDLVLEFPPDRQDRRTLPNGTEFFGASGTVTNAGQVTRRVPPILIVLRDARERIVYTWEVRPAKSALAPGESVTINEAVTDVPKSAKVAEIGWKP